MRNPVKAMFDALVQGSLERLTKPEGGGPLNTFPCSHVRPDGLRSNDCMCELFATGKEIHRFPGGTMVHDKRTDGVSLFILRLR